MFTIFDVARMLEEATAMAARRSVVKPLHEWILEKKKFTYWEAGKEHSRLVKEGFEGLCFDSSLEELLRTYVEIGLLRMEGDVYTLV